ncbi:hypothetical protein ABL78_8360 [Leptomonas seymouri]|uniref:Flagellar attachment zone protein 1 conserved domain-containing protein n=1 Tax=Leptomonas seymouri TaxID=5684 RepID=A0A0N0P275_LEPSE|nr:hypothetical protein ABL78_8360 [Leptomonas seymouri]|eukprot:KPI82629.1 hypothetical protein ABL78_8360 [Leptomonas seymouri]
MARVVDEVERLAAANERLGAELEVVRGAAENIGSEAEALRRENLRLSDNVAAVSLELGAAKVAAGEAMSLCEADRSAAEAELLDVLMELKKLQGINEALEALLNDKDRDIKVLNTHNELWPEPSGDKNQMVTRHTKIFDGNWEHLLRERPEALFAAFVIDSSNACHVPGDHIEKVNFDHD